MIAQGSNNTLTLGELLNKVSEEEIYREFAGVENIPAIISSPLRDGDRNPSFSIYYNDSGRVMYRDFGSGEHGGAIDLVMSKFKINLNDAISLIYDKMINGKDLPDIQRADKVERVRNKLEQIDVKVREWKEHDIQFWKSFGISLNTAKWGGIYPISHIFLTYTNRNSSFAADKYAYAFVEFKDGIKTIKIYQPYSENFKWLNSHDSSVWDLWSRLPKIGNTVILTSSRKDALCLWENLGVPATGLQSENVDLKEHVVDDIKFRFKNPVILYDTDAAGIMHSQRVSSRFNIKYALIPEMYSAKDPSDLYKMYGKDEFRRILINAIKNSKQSEIPF